MQVAANVLLVFLIPLGLLAGAAFRDTKRLSGPDVMGPAFFFVASIAIRWIMAAVALGMLVAVGTFDSLAPWRAVQVVLIYGLFYLVDCAAGSALIAIAPRGSLASTPERRAAMAVGWGFPALLIVMLWVLQAASPVPLSTRIAFVAITAVSAGSIPIFMRVIARTEAAARQANEAFWARQKQRIADGSAQVEAMPPDVPLEKLIPFIVDDWPTEVRGLVFERLKVRTNLDDALVAMLADDRRGPAIRYLAQNSDKPSEPLARAMLDASIAIANQWRSKATSLAEQDVELLSRDSGHCTELAYHCKEAPVDFHPVASAWLDMLHAAPQLLPVTAAVASWEAWLHYNPIIPASAAE